VAFVIYNGPSTSLVWSL